MKIFLIRHGESEGNLRHMTQGRSNTKLSPVGMEQARKVAARLSREHIDAIFSSPLVRADMTAKEIAKQHGLKIIYDDRLLERSYGNFDGKPRDDFHSELEKSGLPRHKFRPEGGESYEDMQDRVRSFCEMLVEKYKGKTVVIVGHGTMNRVFLSIIGHCSIEKAPEIPMENTSVYVIEAVKGKPVVTLANCTRHLDE
jgi:broad specificity phosphatase PhoE